MTREALAWAEQSPSAPSPVPGLDVIFGPRMGEAVATLVSRRRKAAPGGWWASAPLRGDADDASIHRAAAPSTRPTDGGAARGAEIFETAPNA